MHLWHYANLKKIDRASARLLRETPCLFFCLQIINNLNILLLWPVCFLRNNVRFKVVAKMQVVSCHVILFQAVRFLHNLGSLLHYQDLSYKLSDLYFLDPDWLCQLLVQIINLKELALYVDDNGVKNICSVYVLIVLIANLNGYL